MIYYHAFEGSSQESIVFDKEDHCFFFHYVRKGSVIFHYPSLNCQLIPEEHFQVYYIGEHPQVLTCKKNESFALYSISFKESWLTTLKDYSLLVSRFLKSSGNGLPAVLFNRPQPVTIENKRLLNNILSRQDNEAHVKLIFRLLLIPALKGHANPLASQWGSQEDDIIYAVAEWILLHLDEPVTLSMLSKKFLLNEFKLKSMFKKTFGIPVISFQRMARVEKAKQMLSQEGISISAIAGTVGFINTTYFSDFFKRETGYSPSGYRKKMHTNENAFSGDQE